MQIYFRLFRYRCVFALLFLVSIRFPFSNGRETHVQHNFVYEKWKCPNLPSPNVFGYSVLCIFRFLHSIFCSQLFSIPVFLFAFNSNFWLNFKLRKNICCCLLLLLLSRRMRRRRSKRILYHQNSALRWLVSVATLITTYCCDTSEVWLHLKSTYATFVFLLKCHTKIIVKLF